MTPFLHEGETLEKREAVRRYLAEHRYAIAEVTIDAHDWACLGERLDRVCR